jgi:hypothetical protein
VAYTTTQLADAVLQALAVVDGAETPDTTDRTYVTGRYAMLWHDLASHGNELVYWGTGDSSADEIPNPVMGILVDMLTLECGPAFGRGISPVEKMQQRTALERRLRRHVQVQSAGTPVRADYY